MVLAVLAALIAAATMYLASPLAERNPRTVLPRSWRLPLAVGAGLLAGAGGALTEEWWNAPLVGILAGFGVLLGAVDARSKLLPNVILVRFAAVTLPLMLLAGAAGSNWAALLGAAAGGAALFAVYFLLALISPAGMGMGDVKLAVILGFFGGWAGAAAWMGTLLGGFLLGGLAGVGVLLLRRGSRGSTFPFGPGMLLAAFASFVLLA